MRIAIAGISFEALTRSPVTTGQEAVLIYRDQEMIERNLWLVRGMVARLRETADVEICPLLWATALPGGPLTRDVYEKVKQETLSLLAAHGPFDGVCLANHGAMEVDGLEQSGDTDFIVAVRHAIGPDVPLAIAFDLHGNLTPEIAHAGTVFSALRTAPHRDDHETGYRAADQLIAVLEQGLHPQTVLVQIPLLAVGEVAVTHYEPAKSLYADLAKIDAIPGVMQAILMVGMAWNDKPWTGMTTMITTTADPGLAHKLAVELANRVWEARREFVFHMETAGLDEGITRAASSTESPVYISDGGDNTTAGAPGDLTIVLKHMLAAQVKDAVVMGITAPRIVKQCRAAGGGARVELALGDEHISAPRQVLTVTGTVEALGDQFIPGGFQPYKTEEAPWARVRIGDIITTFHEESVGITTPGHFAAVGIDPAAHHIYVVKLGYLHPQLEPIAKRHILLFSPGSSSFDLKAMTWEHVKRPIFPLDFNMTWQPTSYGDQS
jgi:microcystin degradation protein MlrC